MADKRLGLKSILVRGLKIAGLGIAVWGLSLFWPEINRFLTEVVMIKVVLGLGVISLVYILHQYLGWPHDHRGTKRNDPSNPIPNNLTPSVSGSESVR